MKTTQDILKQRIILLIGVIGLIVFTAALPVANLVVKNSLFLAGAIILTYSSYMEKEYFFSCLEVIAAASAVMALMQVSQNTSIVVVAVLIFATVLIMSRVRKLDLRLWLGIIGLILLNSGIIFGQNLIMVAAGIALSAYSYMAVRSGFKVGWVFLILNFIFTGVALCSL